MRGASKIILCRGLVSDTDERRERDEGVRAIIASRGRVIDKSMVALLVALVASSSPTSVWFDCAADEKIVTPNITFSNVSSSPDPVVHGAQQVIRKVVHYNGTDTLTNVTATLSQYWKVLGKWVRFLKIDTDVCKEHAGACPFAPGDAHALTTHHPPLHWGTPYGWYRSKQVFTNTLTGERLGCLDERFEYCKDSNSCKKDSSA